MRKVLNRNHYFVLGFLLGLFLSFYIPEDVWELVHDECPQTTENFIDKFGEDFEPHLNLVNKPLAAKKPVKNVIRPRYYSSELGIREKLFIGVMTSQENINTLATALNRTAAHLVNKIKFFINADTNIKSNFKLKNIVGFTDTRENLRPFHVLKYIADNYLDDYDYFFITPDSAYLDAKKLKALLYHISITFDIYMGRKRDTNEYDGLDMEIDRNYCDLDAGILLSSSVIRKIRTNLDWCVRNAITNYHSVNIGKCVKYSSKVAGCQDGFQGTHINSFAIHNAKLYKDLKLLTRDPAFNSSTVVFPLTSMDDFYILHAYYSRLHLDKLKNNSLKLETKAYHIANGTISNDILEIRWPLGVPPPTNPDTRHDVLTWQLVNETHIFMPDHAEVTRPFSKIELEDFHKILNLSIAYSKNKYPSLEYHSLHTAYKRFDPSRGMDYQIHLRLVSKNNKVFIKSFEIVKPLGRVEIVPSPYVTESTKIAIILPVFEHQIHETEDFIKHYEKTCMENQDNTFLMVVFLYRMNSSSKSEDDPFRTIKSLSLDLSKKFKTDGSQIAWLSIRLPLEFSNPPSSGDIMLSSIYAQNEILSLAVIDLSLRKIGLNSLIMLGSNSMTLRTEFLNRVRMNTIQGFQIFSPIGFMMYPCNFANFCKECKNCDVGQSSGYFDKWNYDVVSFYSRDYVEARKKIENLVPIVRSDNEIQNLLNRADQSIMNVVDMFVRAQLSIHILRGVEPNLRFGNAIKNYFNTRRDIPICSLKEQQTDEIFRSRSKFLHEGKCISIASKKQIGDAIIRYEDKLGIKRN